MGLAMFSLLGCSTKETATCPTHWRRVPTGQVSATVKDHALHLESQQSAYGQLMTLLYKDPIPGDFELTVAYEQFVQGVPGGFVQSIAARAGTSGTSQQVAVAAVGSIPSAEVPAAVGAFFLPPTNVEWKEANTAKGVFSVKRTGAEVVATSTATEGVTVTKNNTDFGTGAVDIGLQIGNNLQVPGSGNATSVVIKKVTLRRADGTVWEDDFSCNSIQD